MENQYHICSFHMLLFTYCEQHPHVDFQATLEYCIKSLNEFSDIQHFLISWEHFKEQYLSFFNIIKYGIYAYCWIYITSQAHYYI